MTQEQKARAYDEAFNRAKSWYTDAQIDFKKSLETLFPGLKCGDEKIRKEIIKCVKNYGPSSANPQLFKNMLAWLEKQGEQKQKQYDIDILEKHITKDSISELAHTVIVRNGWEIVDAEEQKTAWSEKQSEKYMKHGYIATNPEFFQWIYDRLKYVYNENPNVDYMLSLKERIEDMQKFADKVKPKFKVDDWIVDNKNRVGIIVRILDGHYIVSFDGREVQIPFEWEGKLFRKWTIQDAKDGDVLVASDGSLFIFAKLKDNSAYYHFSLCKNGSKEISDGKHAWETANSCYPATESQRDTLLKAMTDAGYEWDAEKKELRLLITNGGDFFESENCNQKSAEWKQENIEELTEFENAMMHIGGSFFGENAGLDPNDTDTIKEQAELLLELVPKQEWSEEDEKNLQGIIDEIQANKNNAPSYDIPVYEGYLNWLKSLSSKK